MVFRVVAALSAGIKSLFLMTCQQIFGRWPHNRQVQTWLKRRRGTRPLVFTHFPTADLIVTMTHRPKKNPPDRTSSLCLCKPAEPGAVWASRRFNATSSWVTSTTWHGRKPLNRILASRIWFDQLCWINVGMILRFVQETRMWSCSKGLQACLDSDTFEQLDGAESLQTFWEAC